MSFEVYISDSVRKQKQFSKYIPFCSDEVLLPSCTITVYEQDRDESLFSRRGLSFFNICNYPNLCAFMEEGYYGITWRDGILIQCGYTRQTNTPPSGMVFIHGDYHNVDLIGRTDKLGMSGVYNLLLSSYQFVAVNAGTLLMHSAAIIYNGEAILFCGVSGAGKSTQAASWIKHYNAKPINFDHPCVIWENDNTPIAYGTPWGGKEDFCMPVGAPIKAIVFVHKSKASNVYELHKGEAFGRLLLNNAFPHLRPEMDEKLMRVVERLVQTAPVYSQECTMEMETPEALHKALYGIK